MIRHGRREFLQGSLAMAGIGLLAGCGIIPPWVQSPPKVPRMNSAGQLSESVTFWAAEGPALETVISYVYVLPSPATTLVWWSVF